MSGLAQSVNVSLSDARAGKRPVALTITLGYEMQCGYPGSGSLVVGLPATEQLPKSFSRGAATLNGKQAQVGFATGKALRVALPPRPEIMCDVIGPGTLRLVLTKAANLGNPRRPRSYPISVNVDGRSFRTSLHINA